MSVEILEEDVSGFGDFGRLRTSMKDREHGSYNIGMDERDFGALEAWRLYQKRRELGDFGRLRTSMKEREADYAVPQGMEGLGRLRLKQKHSEAGYTIEDISEEIMTLEGIGFLFEGGPLGLEDELLATQKQEPAPAPTPQAAQVNKLQDVLDQRRGIITTSEARATEMISLVEAQDKLLEKLDSDLKAATKAGDYAKAKQIELEGNKVKQERTKTAILAVRYAKTAALAKVMAKNVRTQIALAAHARRAKEAGDDTSYGILANAFAQVGKSTADLTKLREQQRSKWIAQNKAIAGGTAPKEAVEAAKQPEAASSDLPGVWAVGDAHKQRKEVEEKIKKSRAAGQEPHDLVEKRYNLARIAHEAHAQGAFGPSSAFGDIEGFGWGIPGAGLVKKAAGAVKGAVKSVAGGVKKGVVATAKAGAKLTKFAACKVAANPSVAQACSKTPDPYAQAGAQVSNILAGACSSGQQAAEVAQESGGVLPPGATGSGVFAQYKVPILIGGGVLTAGILAIALKGRGSPSIMMMPAPAPKAVAGLEAVRRRRRRRR